MRRAAQCAERCDFDDITAILASNHRAGQQDSREAPWSGPVHIVPFFRSGYDFPVVVNTRSRPAQEISDSLLQELREYLVTRQVSNGIALLDANAHIFALLDPAQHNAA